MARVPYRDPVQALNDLSEGRIDATLAALALELPRVQSGKVKLLAVVNRQRSPTAPNVPTAIEAGYPALSYGAYGAIGDCSGPASCLPKHVSASRKTFGRFVTILRLYLGLRQLVRS